MTVRELREVCGLDAFASFALELLVQYEWSRPFRDQLRELEDGTEPPGVPWEALADLWEGEGSRQDSGLRLIAEPVYADGERRVFWRLKGRVCRALSETEGQEEPVPGVRCLNPDELSAEEPEQACYREMLRLKQRICREGKRKPLLLHLIGAEGSAGTANLYRYCREQGKGLMLLSGRMLERTGAPERIGLFREVLLECLLTDREPALYWDGEGQQEVKGLLEELLDAWKGHFFSLVLVSRQAEELPDPQRWEYHRGIFIMEEPDRYQAARLWKEEAGRYVLEEKLRETEAFGEFAWRYRFTRSQIRDVLEDARDLAWSRGRDYVTREDLLQAGSCRTGRKFAGKAVRIETKFRWEDLVLAGESVELLQEICRQSRYWHQVYGQWEFGSKFPYGTGNALLFTGPPGTGKTMAAQIVAGELGLDLFRVDLSTVVSKYIGETEKNLSLIFDEAAKGLCVLFFDEADVLFGKRTEVKDSQDKYSNMEAAFLLQKMENYEGISILATNYQQNMDEAFKRRLKYIIEFPVPAPEERRKIWERVFPDPVPMEENVDYGFLAEQFELTGSNIKNTALNAAFMAAAEGKPVGMSQIIRALRNEYRKSGRRLTREELQQYCMYL